VKEVLPVADEVAPAQRPNNGKKVVAAIAALVVVGGAAGAMYLSSNKATPEPEPEDTKPKLGYATGVTALDENSLQKAVDEMYAKVDEGNIALEYKNDAFSTDGKKFDCYIGNSLANEYDMYIGIYADNSFEDELYLSGLFRPGEAFKEVELSRALDKGDHRVYVSFTQVEEDLETIHGQIMVTMDFHVE